MEKKENNLVSYIVSLPILIAIVSMIGEVFLQSTMVLGEDGILSFPQTNSMMFSSASLALFSFLGTNDLSTCNIALTIPNIILVLAFIFLSSYANKGNAIALHVCTGLYLADTVVSVIFMALSLSGVFPVALRAQDIAIMLILHIVFLIPLVYASIMLFKERRKDGTVKN